MSKHKILFFDVDDTLIHHSGEKSYIPQSTIETLKKLQIAGHIPVIASGRGYVHIKHIMEMLDIKNAVCFNGHMIVVDHKIIKKEPLHQEEVKKLVKYIRRRWQPAIAMDEEVVYVKDLFGKVKRTLRKQIKVLEGAKSNLFTEKIEKMSVKDVPYYGMMYFDKNFKKVNQYSHLDFKKWGNWGYEMSNKGTSKLSGIRWLCDYLNHPQEDIVVFGDNYNDIEMLDGVTHSVAMGNAVEEAKSVAYYVTDHVGNHGIEKACEYLGLI